MDETLEVAKLRVLHVGPAPDYGLGNGIDVAAWPMLAAQVEAGVDVRLLALHKVPAAIFPPRSR